MRTHLASHKHRTEHEMLAAFLPNTQCASLELGDPHVQDLLKRLDVDAFHKMLAEIGGSQPVSRHATLAMMHKIRAKWAFRRIWGDGAMRVSKRWLRQHGFNTQLSDQRLEEVQDAP
jgi:hypothetical protein